MICIILFSIFIALIGGGLSAAFHTLLYFFIVPFIALILLLVAVAIYALDFDNDTRYQNNL